MCKKSILLAVSVVLVVGLARRAYAQCDVLPGQTVTVSTTETCGMMSIGGTLVIESTGSVTGGDGSTLDGAGATITVNGGSFHCTGRFNLGQGSDGYINMNGGTFTVDGTWKFPDEPGGVHRMWINDGVVHSGDIELRGDRDAIIYVGGGVLRLTTIQPGSQYYDPAMWVTQGWLQPADDYDEVVIESKVGYTEITAISSFPRVQFETTASGADEGVTPALLAVTLSQPVASTVTVDYAVTGGTATGGSDYVLADGTLTFEPNQTTQYISIDIINDGMDESDETIIVSLSNPAGGVVLGTKAQHTYTIIDPRPAVEFASSSSSGSETATPALIPVVLSESLADAVTVDYAVTGGSATGGGVDYSLANGTLTFAPGVTTQNISITVVDDTRIENPETIVLNLWNPTGPNVRLGARTKHTFTIADNEKGLMWNGLVWFYSESQSRVFVNSDGALEWTPEKGGQFITRIPTQRLSQTNDVVEITYIWMTDGDHSCPDCFSCDLYCFDDDITCIAGTSDMRVGLFEADGQYVDRDGLGTHNSIFEGYKGYNFRFGPNMRSGPNRWVDCRDEVHKTGNFAKKPVSSSSLMYANEGLMDYLDGFELPPGEYSLFTVRLKRTSSSSVQMSITLNGRTQTDTDSSSSGQPQKIDVLAVHMRNGRPYTRLVLDNICEGVGDADFNGDDIVDDYDLGELSDDWLKKGSYVVKGTEPDAGNLRLHYSFDGALGGDVPSGLVDDTGTYTATIAAGSDSGSTIKYAAPAPAYSAGGTSAQFNNSSWSNDAGDTFLIPNSGGLNFGSFSEFTIGLFINPSSSGSGNLRRLFSEYIYAYMYLDTDNTLNAIRKWGGGAWNENWTLLTKADIPTDSWSHLAMTWDADASGDRFKLYVDGQLAASDAGTSAPTYDSTAGFAIGGYQRETGSTAQFFSGKIDEFRLYDKALSEDEIIYIANNGASMVLIPPDSQANLYEDDIIDFKDFAEFAAQWLDSCD